jgi:hypothetical protein
MEIEKRTGKINSLRSKHLFCPKEIPGPNEKHRQYGDTAAMP